MKRYFIRPVGRGQHTKAWASNRAKAQEIKKQLRLATNLKWRITQEEIKHDNSV